MSTWQDINSRLRACRASSDPVGDLTQLFAETHDAHVAFELGQQHKARGDRDQALHWFGVAKARYPKATFKARAEAEIHALTTQESAHPHVAPVSANPSAATTLHVVSCSRQKIWDDSRVTDPYVPARRAYRGEQITAWLKSPASAHERWLVLSAKYGFIEPDHPIANYDVTFNDSKTGPITDDALRAQVRYQKRWGTVPLASFRRVVVHGSESYVTKTVRAFADTGAVVERADGTVATPHTSSHSSGTLTWSQDRADAIGRALATLSAEVFHRFDDNEPETPVMKTLAAWRDPHLATLMALCLGFTDYQLGAGGADAYWQAAVKELETRAPQAPATVPEFFSRLFKHPVSARFPEAKGARVARVVKRWSVPPSEWHNEPSLLWEWLAASLKQEAAAKTVVLAMKMVDLLHRARTGQYLRFDKAPVIPVDLRIARISASSGLIARDGTTTATLMKEATQIAGSSRPLLVDAWTRVQASAGDVSILRIDSLAWQLAGAFNDGHDREGVSQRIAALLQKVQCPRSQADQLIEELTWAM